MYRYIIPSILAGGKSQRCDINKPFLKINNILLIDKLNYSLFRLGFFLS